MSLRARLLSLTLAMVAIVTLMLVALNLNSLCTAAVDFALASSDMAQRQVKSLITRRIESTPPFGDIADTKQSWSKAVAHDPDLDSLLEQSMVQSRPIVEINVAGEDGIILSSSNPRQVGVRMDDKQDVKALKDANPLARMTAIMEAHDDYQTKVPLGIAEQKTPVFTIQILVSPILLRAWTVPSLQNVGIGSGLALILASLAAYWSASLALRPLTRISHQIDAITSGRIPDPLLDKVEDAQLAIIDSKLSLLGERFRDARQDASQLRTNLEGVLEKLDAGTRLHFENQIAVARRLTAINRLTGRVAHEIKNPLNSIALRLEMLRAKIAEETPEAESEFAILSQEVTRLDRVVRTFLDFNRPVELFPVDIDVAAMSGEILQLLEPEAEQKGVGISLEHPPEAVVVKADPDLLRQALLNVAVNAIEAMDRGGMLRIEVEKCGETCFIRIRDTGPGIPLEQRDKIFQLYYTTKPRGSGIGLAMTFRAVQLHGGTIDVEGDTGKGTTFRVTLPLAGVSRIA